MITFKKSPSGYPFNLAYFIGDSAEFEPALEKELIDQGFAIVAEKPAKQKDQQDNESESKKQHKTPK